MPGYKYRGTNFEVDEPSIGRPRKYDLAPCGTSSAYSRHKRRNEPIDDACRQANIDHCKQRRDQAKGKQ